MNKHDEFLKTVVEKIDELQKERAAFIARVDEKIAALELTYETLTGARREGETEIEKRTRDHQGVEKALALLQDRKRPVSPKSLAAAMRVTQSAAQNRLLALVKLGWAEKVGRGKYRAIAKALAPEVPAPWPEPDSRSAP